MTAFKNTGRAAHELPRNIKMKQAFQRSGPVFNSKIDGLKKGHASFVKLGRVKKARNIFGQTKDGFSKARHTEADASRMYTPAVVLGYKRSLKRQHPNRSLVEIIGVNTKEAARFYLGKRVVYVAGSQTSDRKPLVGKVTRTHGNKGVVQVSFLKNISSTSFGKRCRVLL